MNTPSINFARQQDRVAIVELLNQVKLPTQDLPARLDNFLVAKLQDKLVGVVGLEIYQDNALLRSLAVSADQQGTGLGKELYNAAVALASQKGVQHLYLLTTTAAGFFQKQGFAPVDRPLVPLHIQQTAQFAGVCPASAPVLTKQVSV